MARPIAKVTCGKTAKRVAGPAPAPKAQAAEEIGGDAPKIHMLPAVPIRPGDRPVHACDVVIPYDAANLRWLPAAVESVLNQCWARVILHLIRDGFGCEDDPARRYIDLPNVRLYANDESIGPYRTMHRVWDRLETDFVAVQDSDDIALPNRIWISVETLIQERADIIGASMEQFLSHENTADEPPGGRIFGNLRDRPIHRSRVNGWQLSPNGNVINGTMVARRSAFEKLNGFAPLRMSADGEFSTRSIRAGARVVAIPNVVALRRIHHASLSHGPRYGMDSKHRADAHAYILRTIEQMTPGFNPREFGALDGDRYEAHECRPVLPDSRPRMRNLEFHVSHACNLACSNCSHYSDQKHAGMASAAEADRQFGLWSSRLAPDRFSLLGGEPALNSDLGKIVEIARQHWPHARLMLVTNGFHLARHPDLPRILEKTACRLEISVHHESPEYQDRIAPVRELVARWEREFCLRVKWRTSHARWRRTYQGFGPQMRPFEDGDPAASWGSCASKWCPQIHEGKLWKCPQMAYLGMQADKAGLRDAPEWQPYLAYKPLSPDCNDAELREFVTREVESCCRACPAKAELFELPFPIRGRPGRADHPRGDIVQIAGAIPKRDVSIGRVRIDHDPASDGCPAGGHAGLCSDAENEASAH